ncbi:MULTISPECIES: diaminopropionate ammonia-lyase [Peptoniphilus]|jgi:diaminopropionate ammonia-lyase|uniref:diaminopropionate ammonia-lyase n=1 Tax=Peptoniphilus TaxID=162289 RepID=UPI0008D9FAFE|nr:MULTISPECIES: diaminopropionate ammonia-lyase [Peptoniphilus]MBS6610781.1 diaminopropionate ammonia-lyase [Peptoniphilus harei]MDU2109234.1 diaminopropionate ammonia-lyase [Peptoniphilus lacydonensis]MDU3750784.1 diaminopropionate ammonia-lyase [Peptoniphilus rhinitidis]MDU5378038.1 diaminopropionate ammonia-lyase [Peptoniphilus lacydonensis]MDU5437211.1 diaminopropionate ammonia-lyase [Peptoniphilus lacydonensis]
MNLEVFTKKKNERKEKYDISFLNEEEAKKIYDYHNSFPMYEKTPFIELKNLAEKVNVKNILVKDESYRFGLNAFKVLGGSFAIGKVIAKKLDMDIKDLTFEKLTSKEVKNKLGEITFITATDGNHGRGVAWAANKLNQKAIVYMPRGSAKERVENIEKEGATVKVLDANYDECVRKANKLAEKKGYIMVQDTAWDGYEDIPKWIMQGYMTLAWEMYESLQEKNIKPTHLFLQAGVGSFAAATTGFFTNMYKDEGKPIITVVEPDTVACIYESAIANERVLVGGEHETIMAGLACGEPNTFGLKVLLDNCENFIKVSDEFAAYGMRVLGNPYKDDKKVISGESGAAPFGSIIKILTDDKYKDERKKLDINSDSNLIFVSTEGDTDAQNYLDIVWDGKYESTGGIE